MKSGTTFGNTRVVVIEDDPVLVSMLNELLTDEGYHVFPHSRAADAQLLVRNVQPAVVLLDLRLADDPSRSEAGWRVLDRLVLDPVTRTIPVVLTSGAVDAIEAHRPALLPQHGVRVLLKPYGLDQLLAVLPEAGSPALAPPRSSGRVVRLQRLTPRQTEIARLIAEGYTNAEIAMRLVLEAGTVANHVAHILDRLGVANRAQVAAWAARHGLLDESGALQPAHVA